MPSPTPPRTQNPTSTSPPVVLSVAGYDPSAGAGVLADLKTFSALGVYGVACVTALTVQSTQGVQRVMPLPPDFVVETLDCLAGDVCFAVIKVGMLGSSPIADAVRVWLERRPNVPLVFDPVLKSSSGKDLLDEPGRKSLREAWLARASWITPNLPELAALTGLPEARSAAETEAAARRLLAMATEQGNPALRVVVTGGHADRPDDLLLTAEECRWYSGERIATESTHGTGCTFSSALAAQIALGDTDTDAIRAAKEYVTGALGNAFLLGKGKGPLNHFWRQRL